MEDSGGGENGKTAGTNPDTASHQAQVVASSALFNHAGDGIVASFHSEHTLRVFDYPALTIQENPAAHVGGCIAIAQDPRGRYIASGGHDSIVNLFDVSEWICTRTITCCE
jgi:THO complex subunit 3